MTPPSATELAARLDAMLRVSAHPDSERALNGLQFDHQGPVRRIAAAVDVSQRTIAEAALREANFLIVHHGLFWEGARRVVGAAYARYRALIQHDIAVYSAHLPLDSHPELGNNALLARELGLEGSGPFATFLGVPIGLQGTVDVSTASLLSAADAFSRRHGGGARASLFDAARRTRRWAICTGAGASSETLREAEEAGIDTMIVGEGPHHTAVEAPERGIVVIYAGHYATETLGVAAAAERIALESGLPWDFLRAPTGL